MGYFRHSGNAGDLMASPIGSQNLTDNDKWNLNRLYLHTTGPGIADADDCFIDVPLKTTEAMRIGGGMFINGRFNAIGAPRCPSTSWGIGSLAHYYKLDHDVGRSQGFEVSTINGGPTNVRQYIHNDDDNPYKSGAQSSFNSNVSKSNDQRGQTR